MFSNPTTFFHVVRRLYATKSHRVNQHMYQTRRRVFDHIFKLQKMSTYLKTRSNLPYSDGLDCFRVFDITCQANDILLENWECKFKLRLSRFQIHQASIVLAS